MTRCCEDGDGDLLLQLPQQFFAASPGSPAFKLLPCHAMPGCYAVWTTNLGGVMSISDGRLVTRGRFYPVRPESEVSRGANQGG